ncbi:MAG: glycosyltransferase [Hyphomicrobiaceae bacterium]|nr:glycosyltransferase [Hyphomicrobiaceae bacterium]
MSDLELSLSLLASQSATALMLAFWYTLVFEVPRYLCGFLALAALSGSAGRHARRVESRIARPRITVGVIGHNEADALERCVRSLHEQSIGGLEIVIVSDGSNDGMARIAQRLVREGLAAKSFATDLRSGKSAGLNLAIGAASGDIFVVVDCDCSYDRFAIEAIVAPFDDPRIGAVAGDIVPRNPTASLVARFQSIEYLTSITVGKRVGDALRLVDCISGAFGAFRLAALRGVGCFDVGGGEDLDLTMRLRAAGWSIAFQPEAICYTDVPVRLWGLVRQRLRWERDSVRIRYRKYGRFMNPWRREFRILEAVHQWDFLLFGVLGAIIFPVYIVWLFQAYGDFALVIVIASQLALFGLDALMLLLAAIAAGRPAFWPNLPYLLGYSVFQSYVMRLVRLWAYIEEWLLFASVNDNYVPLKVRTIRKW